jgi:hypothetical protein
MEGAPIEGEWGSDAQVSPTPSPPGEEAETLKIPPLGSGARLGFLLGVKPSAAGSRGAKGGSQGGLPPMSGTATSRKRGRAPPVRVQEKGFMLDHHMRSATRCKWSFNIPMTRIHA